MLRANRLASGVVVTLVLLGAAAGADSAASARGVPAGFLENRGQFDSAALFQARTSGGVLWVTCEGWVHHLVETVPGIRSAGDPAAVAEMPLPGDALRRNYAVRVLLEDSSGADSRGAGTPLQVSHFFLGSDPARWATDALHYSRVVAPQVYPGIDLELCARREGIEYRFCLDAGANPACIRLRYEGAESLAIDPDGNLVAETPLGVITERRPRLFQSRAGCSYEVPGCFELVAPDTVGFIATAGFDPTLPLVIDPVLAYATYLGGPDEEDEAGSGFPGSLAVGSDGDIRIVGTTDSVTELPIEGGWQPEHGGGPHDVFVARISPDGTGEDDLVFSTYLGGDDADVAFGIDLDADGNVYVTGETRSADYPVTAGALKEEFDVVEDGPTDSFVTKLSPLGNSLEYSTYLGGDGNDRAVGVKVHESDEGATANVTGYTYSADFPTTPGCYQAEKSPDFCGVPSAIDVFLARLSAGGDELLYGTYLGGAGFDTTYGLDVDADGDVYLAGGLGSDDIAAKGAEDDPLGRPAYDSDFGGTTSCIYAEGFVAKLHLAGEGAGDLVYLTYLGGDGIYGSEYVFAVYADEEENAYVAGRSRALDFPIANPLPDEQGGAAQEGKDMAFAAKLNPYGTAADFCTFLTGPDPAGVAGMTEWAYGIEPDAQGDVWVTGQSPSVLLPVTGDAIQTRHGDATADNGFAGDGENDLWIARLALAAGDTPSDPPQLRLEYMTYFGGSGPDCQFGFALDDEEATVFVGGISGSTDFPVTAGAFQEENAGLTDLFIVQVDAPPEFVRGDTFPDGAFNLLDALVVLQYLFAGGDLGCKKAADVNDSNAIDIADPIYLLQYLFVQGQEPAPPFEKCGLDTTADTLGCRYFPACD